MKKPFKELELQMIKLKIELTQKILKLLTEKRKEEILKPDYDVCLVMELDKKRYYYNKNLIDLFKEKESLENKLK